MSGQIHWIDRTAPNCESLTPARVWRGAMAEEVSNINATASTARFFDRARTIASPKFNRWLVPPCALAIHVCIGMAYGFSVFWLPMRRLLPAADSAQCQNLGL